MQAARQLTPAENVTICVAQLDLSAMRVATDDAGAPFEVTPRESALAADLYRFGYRLPSLALDSAVSLVFAGMSSRYGERLGVDAGRVEAEHRALVAAIRT